MVEEILSYDKMCTRENTRLIKGINFNLGDMYSVVLMSRKPDAPYHDTLNEDDTILTYEGHDVDKTGDIDPKTIDQPERTSKGKLTYNGKFHEAAQQFQQGDGTAERVKVYEHLEDYWVYRGFFLLTDSDYISDGTRNIFKFTLTAMDETQHTTRTLDDIHKRKIIPIRILTNVLEKSGLKCYQCESTNELSFILTNVDSITDENVKIVCNEHNPNITN